MKHSPIKMRQVNKIQEENEAKKQHVFHNTNPFIGALFMDIEQKQYRKVAGSTYQDVIKEGGEIEKQKILVLGEKKVVDKKEFYKIYMGEIKAFFDLSKATMKLVDYIMGVIQYNKDKVCLYQPDIMEQLQISRATCHRAISQLLDAQIIAKADTVGCYFVNPNVMFKGNRIALFKEYQIKDSMEDPYAGMNNTTKYLREPESEYYSEQTEIEQMEQEYKNSKK